MTTPDRPQLPNLTEVPERPLTVPLLSRGSFDDKVFVGLLAGAIISAQVPFWCFADLVLGSEGVVAILAASAIPSVFTVLAVVYGLMLVRRRGQVEMTTTGFVLSRRGQRRVFTDDQVVEVTQQIGGIFGGDQKRRIILKVGGDRPERIECRYTVQVGNTDPLAGFVSRLVGVLTTRIDRGLEDGATLIGDGWSLDARGLRVRREVYSLEGITGLGIYDQRLCLWRADEERPFLRLPQGSRNVLPLGEILRRRLLGRPGFGLPPTSLPLGRLLLERRSWDFYAHLRGAGIFGLVVLFFLVPAVGKLLGGERDAGPVILMALAALACGGFVTLLVGFMAWRERNNWLRFHERGVCQTGAGDSCLLYEEIGEVTWDRSLFLEPMPGLDRRMIRFRLHTWKHEADLASVRDLACRHLARRWLAEVAGAPVRWTQRLRFLPDGLEFLPDRDWHASQDEHPPFEEEWDFVPYEDLSSRIDSGQFLLFVRGHGQAVCREPTTEPNFYVGLLVLDWLCQGRALRPAEVGEAAPRPMPTEDDRVTPGPAEGVRQREAEKDLEP